MSPPRWRDLHLFSVSRCTLSKETIYALCGWKALFSPRSLSLSLSLYEGRKKERNRRECSVPLWPPNTAIARVSFKLLKRRGRPFANDGEKYVKPTGVTISLFHLFPPRHFVLTLPFLLTRLIQRGRRRLNVIFGSVYGTLIYEGVFARSVEQRIDLHIFSVFLVKAEGGKWKRIETGAWCRAASSKTRKRRI